MKKILAVLSMAALTGALHSEELSEKGFVRNWLISGPYPSYQTDGKGKALDTDFLKGESRIRPYAGLKGSAKFIADKAKLIAKVGSTNEWGYTDTKTFDTTWKVWKFDADTIKMTEDSFPVKDYFCAYAVCYLDSPKAQEVSFYVGSDDDHKLYVNGQLIGTQASSQAADPQFRYKVQLLEGINTVVLKVVDRTGEFGFSLGISDAQKNPVPGLKVYTEHPGRKYGVDSFGKDCGITFLFDAQDLMDGPHKLNLKIHNPKKYTVTLNGEKVSALPVSVNLEQGKRTFTVDFLQGSEKIISFSKTVTVYSEKALREENAKLVPEINQMKKILPQLKKEAEKVEKESKAVRRYLEEAYAFREKKYEEERQQNIKDAPRSVSEKLEPVSLRSSLCLNGAWQASVDQKKWEEVLLPNWMMHFFFVAWYYPVRKLNPKESGGVCVPTDALKDDFVIGDTLTATHAYFRTTFESDGTDVDVFTSTAVIGKLKVFCNGTLCGSYEGKGGILEFPLKNVKKGANELLLEFEKIMDRHCETYGLRGDLYLKKVPAVRVQDIYIKPSWRKGALETRTEVLNSTGKAVEAEICQYAVEGNTIRHRLPVRKTKLEPGKVSMLTNVSRWADPKLWGPGGKYGNPDLYDLVTDIKVNGKTVDRHVQRFGFREFWIFQTDFFLNGKRIILQGDLGTDGVQSHLREIKWDLMRRDNINIFRLHDSDAQWCVEAAEDADRTGMLLYVQWYPWFSCGFVDNEKNPTPADKWSTTAEHKKYLEGYDYWFRMFRNHPSVVVWSTDNEILTQAINSEEVAAVNVRRDKIAALYEKYMAELEPDLVLTRDGDIGTWNHKQRWFEDPPCVTANYHYPDFNIKDFVYDWQEVYEYRPVIFGETLYHSYGAWDHWIGAIPKQVNGKANTVRRVASLYRELGVPGQIYMGLSLDGFIVYDNTGKGNPWGITEDQCKAFSEKQVLPPGMSAKQYPHFKIKWPAYSGKGFKIIAAGVTTNVRGAFNWFDSRYPTHVRNAVNDAYRDSLIPQEPLRTGSNAECVIVTKPETSVWTVLPSGERYGVRADKQGKAWFQLADPGKYTFTGNGKVMTLDIPDRSSYALKPGFENVKSFELK